MNVLVKGHIFILTLLILAGCLPESKPRQALRSKGANTVNNPTDTSSPSEDSKTKIKWYSTGSFGESYTVDSDNLKSLYLRGDDLSDFLQVSNNYASDYCLVVNFQMTALSSPKQLRMKVVANSYTDYLSQKIIRYFRVNSNTIAGNSLCNLNIRAINPTTGASTLTAPPAALANQVQDVCPTCTNILTSTNVTLYKVERNTSGTPQSLFAVEPSYVDYRPLIFRIDMNNNSNNNPVNCSDSNCKSLGFDCCLQGQCVKEAAPKTSGINLDPAGFQLAEQEKASNPKWYLKYPQFYFSCLKETPKDPDNNSGGPSDGSSDANNRLIQLRKDYQCIKELESKSLSTPFHREPKTVGAVYTQCKTNATDANDNMYFETVMKRMYQNCGCSETTLPNMVANCPAYNYKATFDNTTITEVSCLSPEAPSDPKPFQNLQVLVNSKNAPHRFFNTDNVEINPYKVIPSGVSTTQEGDTFQYLDREKLFPVIAPFGMNAILGQMTTSLDQAKPATVIDLEFDKEYYIAVLKGNYTPCLNCAKDSWFNNFSASPSTAQGLGLKAIGHTTSRDRFGTNLSFGNYEDTIFGRACFIPPTMIPWSHSKNANGQNQRLNRLKTQAAFFVNGYQRDWYGFNKNALIGSFDGVSWFAIGKGRVVKATTNKLYLAINAPFADLAESSDHTVSVSEYDFITTGAKYDYDPSKEASSPFQNEAGLCQSHHDCSNDADCITTLGWEYVCADVTATRTKWPVFDPNTAKEKENDEQTGSIAQFLAQKALPSGSTKRCVYRGAGAPCKKNLKTIGSYEQRKLSACAPNFHCADLTTSNNFNKEVSRFAAPLESLLTPKNHLYGQDALILGRPKHYIGYNDGTGHNTTNLDTTAQNNIKDNFVLQSGGVASDLGMCRPGKLLPSKISSFNNQVINWNPLDQHKQNDTSSRTDYINQIAPCNSTLHSFLRYSSCPIIDQEGNYAHLSNNFNTATNDFTHTNINFNFSGGALALSPFQVVDFLAKGQNHCGLDVLDPSFFATLSSVQKQDPELYTNANASPFTRIEGRNLASANTIVEKTLTRDACLRKAGSICHTDLDCAPNRLHGENVDLYPNEIFGILGGNPNNAERAYWSEALICGQADPEPNFNDTNFNDYNVKNNRCCRAVGKDLTMYSENDPQIPFTSGLETRVQSGVNPASNNKYSRYSILNTFTSITANAVTPNPSAINWNFATNGFPSLIGLSNGTANGIGRFAPPNGFIKDANNDGIVDENPNIFTPYQWTTISETGSKTCCGGGWIRKFADGTNNWKVNRLNLEPNNWKCINTYSPLVTSNTPSDYGIPSTTILQNDRRNMCLDSSAENGGCAIRDIDSTNPQGTTTLPRLNATTQQQVIYTFPNDMTGQWATNTGRYVFSFPNSADANPINFLNWSLEHTDTDLRRNVSIFVPAWITFRAGQFDSDVDVQLGNRIDTNLPGKDTCTNVSAPNPLVDPNTFVLAGPTDFYTSNAKCAEANGCCYEWHEQQRILKVTWPRTLTVNTQREPDNNANFGASGTVKDISLILRYYAPGTLEWENRIVGGGSITDNTNATLPHRRSMTSGDMNYYLYRFENLELLGIPQISYPPLYCSNNYQQLVPGTFKDSQINPHSIVSFNQHNDTVLQLNPLTQTEDTTQRPFSATNLSVGGYPSLNATSLNRAYVAPQSLVDHSPVFSGHEFKCCRKLGDKVTDTANCCSGHGVSDSNSSSPSGVQPKFICKLPAKTNLNVYFNRFVSNEGTNPSDSATLTASDFDPSTGWPKKETSVGVKISNLGAQHCESGKTVRGGAFGPFNYEIDGRGDGESGWQIVDSVFDEATQGDRTVGYKTFKNGYRWNHHIYCAP